MQRVELEFAVEQRFWSPDHGSILFPARYEKREIRFFVPRACLTSLRKQDQVTSDSNLIWLFEKHIDAVIDAAKVVFTKDGGISSAYVVTDIDIEFTHRSPAVASLHLAA